MIKQPLNIIINSINNVFNLPTFFPLIITFKHNIYPNNNIKNVIQTRVLISIIFVD